MMKIDFVVLLFTLVAFSACQYSNNWAVLIAGSKGYKDYRHQADVFHTYQILLQNGYHRDRIIVFAYDDIAYCPENPFPGHVFNQPNGNDVYCGVRIDYRFYDVTPQNFMNVLAGQKAQMWNIGTGRVLESTSQDNVFIYFSDHGADSLLCFPNHFFYANDLYNVLYYMHEARMYKNLVFSIEACFSGSMFEKIPPNWNIYATTAANRFESSYAYYCDETAVVNGINLRTCLSDEYSSVSLFFIEFINNPSIVTLHSQYDYVRSQVKQSHPMEFGDFNLGYQDVVANYFFPRFRIQNLKKCPKNKTKRKPFVKGTRIDSRKVTLNYLKNKAETTNSDEDLKAYEKELKLIDKSRKKFEQFQEMLDIPDQRGSMEVDYDCLKLTVESYKVMCGYNERDLEFMNVLTTACSMKLDTDVILDTLQRICQTKNKKNKSFDVFNKLY